MSDKSKKDDKIYFVSFTADQYRLLEPLLRLAGITANINEIGAGKIPMIFSFIPEEYSKLREMMDWEKVITEKEVIERALSRNYAYLKNNQSNEENKKN